ncbi:hypothetical protein [Deinococcus maricopensis]|uniref:Uncharacterized protein n=1 Tax=Deinococcus maricopensis (strain DSM 21211 / LMG 22137 / NRRL B-23946 / LB-34) TaxID=709986 RepID=E8U585_DEIML|nr:hypothetical protein [Deinococcus maricopensis]ADV66224.1 hypothetical protein Deima_0565 [Deinococcus maricopensis DSM 21211]
MKVGLLDSFGARAVPYWEAFLRALELEVVRPALSAEEAYAIGRDSLPDEPPHVQLALGRVLELARTDAVVLPGFAGVHGDPWGEDFADVLTRRVSVLPPLVTTPAPGTDLAPVAADIGQRLTRNAGRVRLALDRAKLYAGTGRGAMPPLTAASRATVAVIGPDALLADPFLSGPLRARLQDLGLHGVFASDLPRDQVVARAARFEARSAGEAELQGALGLLEGKSPVRGVVFVAPARDAATRTYLKGLADRVRKPTLLLDLDPDDQGTLAPLDGFAGRVQVGASTRDVHPEDDA